MNTALQIGYRTLALEYGQTREQWLERAAALMRQSLIPQLAGHRCRVSLRLATQGGRGAYGEEGRGVLVSATLDRPHQPQSVHLTGAPGSN